MEFPGKLGMAIVRYSYNVMLLLAIFMAHALALYAIAGMNAVPPLQQVQQAQLIQGVLIAASPVVAVSPQPPRKVPQPQKPKKTVPQPVVKSSPEPSVMANEATVKKDIQKPVDPENNTSMPDKPSISDPVIAGQHAAAEKPPVSEEASGAEEEPVTIPPRVDAENLDNPVPAYPPVSRRLQETGTVVLEILVLPDGSVGDIRLGASSGYKRLDNAAMRAVKGWRYLPARRGNEYVSYWYKQPVNFTLQ
jgi:protein TonB